MNEHAERLHLHAVSLSFDLLAEFLRGTGHFFRVRDGLPVDARPLYATCDLLTRAVTIVFEHESFPGLEDDLPVWKDRASFEWRFPIDPEIVPVPWVNVQGQIGSAGRWEG